MVLAIVNDGYVNLEQLLREAEINSPESRNSLNELLEHYGVPVIGKNRHKKIKLSPYNLWLFFMPKEIPAALEKYFGIKATKELPPEFELCEMETLVYVEDEENTYNPTPVIVDGLTRKNIDLEKGAFLTAGQVAYLLEHVSPGDVHDIFSSIHAYQYRFDDGYVRYFTSNYILSFFPKPDLTTEEKLEIQTLAAIVTNKDLAAEYCLSETYVAMIASARPDDRQFKDLIAHSDKRIEDAMILYRKPASKRFRRVIGVCAFEDLAIDITKSVCKHPEKFFSPYYGLAMEMFGISKEQKERISNLIGLKVRRYVRELLIDMSVHPELYEGSFKREEETITQFAYTKARESFAGQFHQKYAQDFERALDILEPKDRLYLELRYQLGKNLAEQPYVEMTHADIAAALGANQTLLSKKEKRIISTLMHAPNIYTLSNFADRFEQDLQRANALPY